MRLFVTSLILVLPLLLSGCETLLPEPHKLDIQQGNRLKQADVDKLQIGMTRKQVEFLLGTPLLKDGFHGNRWDYIDYFKPGKGEPQQSRLSLHFEGEQLIRIDTSHYLPRTDTQTESQE